MTLTIYDKSQALGVCLGRASRKFAQARRWLRHLAASRDLGDDVTDFNAARAITARCRAILLLADYDPKEFQAMVRGVRLRGRALHALRQDDR